MGERTRGRGLALRGGWSGRSRCGRGWCRQLAVRLLPLPLRPFRPLPVPFRLVAAVPVRLLPLRLLLVPFRFRPEPLLALCSSGCCPSLRLPFRLVLRCALFRSLRLPLLPRPFRAPAERSVEAVRVRAVVREFIGCGCLQLVYPLPGIACPAMRRDAARAELAREAARRRFVREGPDQQAVRRRIGRPCRRAGRRRAGGTGHK